MKIGMTVNDIGNVGSEGCRRNKEYAIYVESSEQDGVMDCLTEIGRVIIGLDPDAYLRLEDLAHHMETGAMKEVTKSIAAENASSKCGASNELVNQLDKKVWLRKMEREEVRTLNAKRRQNHLILTSPDKPKKIYKEIEEMEGQLRAAEWRAAMDKAFFKQWRRDIGWDEV